MAIVHTWCTAASFEGTLTSESTIWFPPTEPVMAQRLLDRKMARVEATGATTVVTANPGCILQLAAGLRARGRNVEVLHVVEVLDRAYQAAERPAP